MGKVQNILKNTIGFAGPIIFEITNQVTGDWINTDGKLEIRLGKFITILIAVLYFCFLGYFTYKDYKDKKDIHCLEEQLEKNKKKIGVYKSFLKSVENILAYTTEKTKDQLAIFKKDKEIDTSYVNSTNAATIVCRNIYNAIMELLGDDKDVTVNYYRKYMGEDGKTYTNMIGHEGYNTTPKFFLVPRLLKRDRDIYYCEKLLLQNNPDIVFWKNRAEVAKAFGILKEEDCKYTQYAAIPIRRFGSEHIVGLIEIVAHNNSIMWNDIEEVRKFERFHCKMFEEYFLLIDMLESLYCAVNKYQMGDIRYGKNNRV